MKLRFSNVTWRLHDLRAFLWCFVGVLGSTAAVCRADNVLFVKNQWTATIYVWANGTYQGYVPAGKVAYMPQEGFVTTDSGVRVDGSLKMEHAYGGWESRSRFEIRAASAVVEREGEKVSFFSEGSIEDYKNEKYWAFGTKNLVPPTSLDGETAMKMPQGTEPSTVLELFEVGTTEFEEPGGGTVTGLVGPNGASSLMMLAGAEGSEGTSFSNGIGMKMIWVDEGYYLAATETTQDQWEAVMGGNPSKFNGGDLPVESMSWNDAMSFCQRLTQRESAAGKLPKGYVYTLPTEEQWEYACRAGTRGDYAGDLDAMAWYSANSGGRTHAVGTMEPNAWGFYDMHGNVWEWCENSYQSDRANRGGSWAISAERCASGSRAWLGPGIQNIGTGFRPALVPGR